ncbi:hypothetical protein LCGC14_2758620, partial [marine sediment metagenome]
ISTKTIFWQGNEMKKAKSIEKWEFSKEFLEVKDRAFAKAKGYLSGLEYLLWIPFVQKFGLFLMGNPTLRRESPNVKSLMRKACTLKIEFIDPKGSSYSWHGASAFQCTTPMDIPDEATLLAEIAKFREPKDSAVEFVDDDKKAGRAR